MVKVKESAENERKSIKNILLDTLTNIWENGKYYQKTMDNTRDVGKDERKKQMQNYQSYRI